MTFQSTFRKGECETEKIKPEALNTLNPGVGLYFSKFLVSHSISFIATHVYWANNRFLEVEKAEYIGEDTTHSNNEKT